MVTQILVRKPDTQEVDVFRVDGKREPTIHMLVLDSPVEVLYFGWWRLDNGDVEHDVLLEHYDGTMRSLRRFSAYAPLERLKLEGSWVPVAGHTIILWGDHCNRKVELEEAFPVAGHTVFMARDVSTDERFLLAHAGEASNLFQDSRFNWYHAAKV